MTDPGPRPPPCLWSSLFDPLPGVIDFDYARPATFLTSPLPIESAAVQPAPVISLPAPSRSTAPAPANTIERRVGEIVAAAGMAIIEALQERADGGLTSATKMRGGDLICELFRWRKFLIADYPTFDAMARARCRGAAGGRCQPRHRR